MKKILGVSAIVLALFIMAAVLLRSDVSVFQKEDPGLVRYWERQGLSEKEARYLARQGQNRTDVPATSAAQSENNLSVEEISNAFVEEEIWGVGGELVSGINNDCQEQNCPKGGIARKDIRASSSSVFLESNVSVVTVSLYCFGRPPRLGDPLFTELYLSEEKWSPRYILQPLSKIDLDLTSYGKRDLRSLESDFLATCR